MEKIHKIPDIMRKIGEIFKGEHGSFMRYAVAVTFIFLLFVLFKPGNNIFNWLSARHEIAVQEKQMARYRENLEELDKRINLLMSDKDTLEKFAREQFHLAAPGEDVYIMEE